MNGNLPDDVTHADIDKHFGTPDVDRSAVGAAVLVDVESAGYDKESTERDAKEQIRDSLQNTDVDVIHIEIENIEPI